MVFQFKKPISYTSDRNDNYTKFIIKTEQHYNLLRSLRNKQAFYIFVALNNISEIKSNRTDITLNQRSRVLRMVKSSLAPKMEIAGRRKFGTISSLVTLEELCNQFVTGLAGSVTAVPNLPPLRSFMKNNNSQHTYLFT
jgi:hypothetical protein